MGKIVQIYIIVEKSDRCSSPVNQLDLRIGNQRKLFIDYRKEELCIPNVCLSDLRCYAIVVPGPDLVVSLAHESTIRTSSFFASAENFVLEPLCLPNTSFVTHQGDATSVGLRERTIHEGSLFRDRERT